MQTSYSIDQGTATAGLLGDLNPMVKRTFNNPADIILFGHAVAKVAADDNGAKKPAASNDVILGVAIRSESKETDSYPADDAVAVLSEGDIWVPVEEAVSPGDGVFIRYLAVEQEQTITLDADLVTANVISIDVNGTTISHTFATDHDTSMAAWAVKLAAHPDIETATLEGGDNREVTIVAASPDADVLLENESITGGASQAGIVVAETVASIPNADRGKFRNDDGGTTALDFSTRGEWIIGGVAGGLALLHLNHL